MRENTKATDFPLRDRAVAILNTSGGATPAKAVLGLAVSAAQVGLNSLVVDLDGDLADLIGANQTARREQFEELEAWVHELPLDGDPAELGVVFALRPSSRIASRSTAEVLQKNPGHLGKLIKETCDACSADTILINSSVEAAEAFGDVLPTIAAHACLITTSEDTPGGLEYVENLLTGPAVNLVAVLPIYGTKVGLGATEQQNLAQLEDLASRLALDPTFIPVMAEADLNGLAIEDLVENREMQDSDAILHVRNRLACVLAVLLYELRAVSERARQSMAKIDLSTVWTEFFQLSLLEGLGEADFLKTQSLKNEGETVVDMEKTFTKRENGRTRSTSIRMPIALEERMDEVILILKKRFGLRTGYSTFLLGGAYMVIDSIMDALKAGDDAAVLRELECIGIKGDDD